MTFSSDPAEMNSTFRDDDDRNQTDEVPVEDLLLMEGETNRERVQVLKDDGCNTNVVSCDFVHDHRALFRISRNS